eukprot:3571416-Rhodomonas_salina.1
MAARSQARPTSTQVSNPRPKSPEIPARSLKSAGETLWRLRNRAVQPQNERGERECAGWNREI